MLVEIMLKYGARIHCSVGSGRKGEKKYIYIEGFDFPEGVNVHEGNQ